MNAALPASSTPSAARGPGLGRRAFIKQSLLACASAGLVGSGAAQVARAGQSGPQASGAVTPDPAGSASHEWDARRASDFWPEQRSHWAPVSWKDHPYNFNVLYNGTLIASPSNSGLNPFVLPEDRVFGAELRVNTSLSSMGASGVDSLLYRQLNPDGRQVVSWGDGPAPEYVMEHAMRKSAVYLEQRQFAYVPGGKALRRGNEPHFLWVRFIVSEVVEFINPVDHVYAYLSLLKPSTYTEIAAFNNINPNFGYGIPAYAFPLHLDYKADWSQPAWLRLGLQGRTQPRPATPYRSGRRNRLAFPAGQTGIELKYLESKLFLGAAESLAHLELKIPAKVGAHVDFVLPMVPPGDRLMEQVLSLGYDGALAEAGEFWASELKTSTSVRMPEPLVQSYFTQFPRLQAMLGQKEPTSGEFALRTSSMHYEIVWSTPMAWGVHGLGLLGHHREADKYLEPYRLNQGRIKPASPLLAEHPGYLGAPEAITHVNWITDHAAILWAAANHGLLTMDRAFIDRWTDPIVRACEFIGDARRTGGHRGYRGIMPPANPNDTKMFSTQFVWNDAWYHKALRAGARFLEHIGHPRGAAFREEADAYRADFQRAFRDVVARGREWAAPDGTRVPFVPMALTQPTDPDAMYDDAPVDGGGGRSSESVNLSAGHPFFLDTGALSLVFGELFRAGDPLMQASLRWFREGPQLARYRPFSCPYQPPVLWAEMSSCEPLYSFNPFHSYQLEDRERFVMGLYSQFAGGVCRGNQVGCETREGVFGMVNTLPLLLTRMALVQEEDDDSLHLLRLAPLAFFKGEGFAWRSMPTFYGEVSLSARWAESTRQLVIDYTPPARRRPAHTLLHVPPFAGLAGVTVNGAAVAARGGVVAL